MLLMARGARAGRRELCCCLLAVLALQPAASAAGDSAAADWCNATASTCANAGARTDPRHCAAASTVHTTSMAGGVTVVTPGDATRSDVDALATWCRGCREWIRATVLSRGGLVLRGWRLRGVADAERLIFEAMGFPTAEPFPQVFLDFNARAARLGVPPGGITQSNLSRDAPRAQRGVMQPPHQEFGLSVYRPRVVSFYVEEAPKRGADGASGRVYLPDAARRLPPQLLELFRENGWWNPLAGAIQPAVMLHPETGVETLQLYSFTQPLAAAAKEAYAQVRREHRPDLPNVDSVDYGGSETYSLQLVRPNGTRFELPKERVLEYFRAMFLEASLHEHQTGDLLLFDNLLYGHFRMPGAPPRKLHAMVADEVDVRTLRPPDAPACVNDAAEAEATRAIEALLGQFGTGGNLVALRSLLFLPDALFQLAGHVFWAEWK